MRTIKIILAVLFFRAAIDFFIPANADAWPRHRHPYHRVYVRRHAPRPVLVWVPGHWAHNKFGKPVWRKGHWRRVYRY